MAGTAKGGGQLFTLTEVSKRTGISMPTLQRYKKLYQSRIPSEGKGRKQRYPATALAVFDEIKKENIGKRGRPRKADSTPAQGRRKVATASKRGRKASTRRSAARQASAPKSSELLTLTEISRLTGISYPTLSRYVKEHSSKLKHEGTGRSRRFYQESVSVFKELRQASGRGGRKKGTRGLVKRAAAVVVGDAELVNRVKKLEKQVNALERRLSKQIRLVIPGR